MWSSMDTHSVFQVPQRNRSSEVKDISTELKSKEERHYKPPECDPVTWKQACDTIPNASQNFQTLMLPIHDRSFNVLTQMKTPDRSAKFHNILEWFWSQIMKRILRMLTFMVPLLLEFELAILACFKAEPKVTLATRFLFGQGSETG